MSFLQTWVPDACELTRAHARERTHSQQEHHFACPVRSNPRSESTPLRSTREAYRSEATRALGTAGLRGSNGYCTSENLSSVPVRSRFRQSRPRNQEPRSREEPHAPWSCARWERVVFQFASLCHGSCRHHGADVWAGVLGPEGAKPMWHLRSHQRARGSLSFAT